MSMYLCQSVKQFQNVLDFENNYVYIFVIVRNTDCFDVFVKLMM